MGFGCREVRREWVVEGMCEVRWDGMEYISVLY